MPTLKEQYGQYLSTPDTATTASVSARPMTLKERYGYQITGKPNLEGLNPKLVALHQPVQPSAEISGDIDSRDFLDASPMPAASTAVSADLHNQLGRSYNPLGILPKGTTEKFMQMMAENPFYGGLFGPPERGAPAPEQPSIYEPEGSDWGRGARNLARNVAQFIPEQLLGALEDPAAAGQGLVEFPFHVGGTVAKAAGLAYGQPPEVGFEARQTMLERPLDVAMLAAPFALAGLKRMARGGGISEAGRTKIIRQIEKAREFGASEAQIRNAVGDDALVTHALRRLDAEVPVPVPGKPGSRSRIEGNIAESQAAREAARPDFDRQPLLELDRALEADRSARSVQAAEQAAAREAGKDYIQPKPDPLVEIGDMAKRRDARLLFELVELGYDPVAVAKMTPDELAYYGSGGRIGKLPEPAKAAPVPEPSAQTMYLKSTPGANQAVVPTEPPPATKPPEIRTETPRPATPVTETGIETPKSAPRPEGFVGRPEAVPEAAAGVRNVPLSEIRTDVDRFQNRVTSFSEETAATVAERFDPNKFDPVVLWKDPATNETFVISGHSRLEGMSRRKAEAVPARYFEGTETDAINFARIEANRLQTKETVVESISAFERAKSEGYTKAKMKDLFDGDVDFLDSVRHLNRNGKFIEILGQTASNEFPYIKRFARWVGELRGQFEGRLTNRHESQLFDFLYKESGRNYEMTKDQFFDLVSKNVDRLDFSPNDPLVLKRGTTPMVGTRGRQDTAWIENKIDELKTRRNQAKTVEERQALDAEIAKLRQGIGDIVKKQADIFAQPGTVASPGSTARKSLTVSMEPETPRSPIGKQAIVDHFRNEFGIPIKVGKFRQKAYGIYKIKPEVIRSREALDLSNIAHEIGHHLENKFLGGLGKKSELKVSREAKRELIRMGKELYGDRQPVGGYRSEGFAEFIAHWLTTDKFAEVAPKFAEFFEKSFLPAHPDVAKTLREGQTLVRQWRQQGAVDRVYANIDIQGKGTPVALKDRLADLVLKARTLLVDDIAPLEHVEKQIRKGAKIDPRTVDPITSPSMLARSFARTATAKAKSMVLDGTFILPVKKLVLVYRRYLRPFVPN
jgi:hypothetical protein